VASWNYLNGFGNYTSLLVDANSNNITQYRRQLYFNLSESLFRTWRPYQDSGDDTLADFTGPRRRVLNNIGDKIWHRNIDYDRDGAEEEAWYDIMASTPIVSHMEQQSIVIYDEEGKRTVMAIYDATKNESVLHLFNQR
jgi:hypothetical protein